jgi:hypothetical protein
MAARRMRLRNLLIFLAASALLLIAAYLLV